MIKTTRSLAGIYWWRGAGGVAALLGGLALFFELPIRGTALIPAVVAHYGISLGGILAFVGAGLIMTAFPKTSASYRRQRARQGWESD